MSDKILIDSIRVKEKLNIEVAKIE